VSDPGTLIDELKAAARALDKGSTQLADVTKQFEGWYEETEDVDPITGEVVTTRGEWHEGPNLLWRVAISEAIDAIVREDYAETRAPAIERLERMAELRVRQQKPDLYADYHRLATEIDALQKWISAKKQAISARQSVLSAEKELAR
jgi:hypothetical protein